MYPLIAPEELMSIVGEIRVCDVRWDLVDPAKGRETYESGHIPDAVFVDLDTDLAGPPGRDGRHPLPPVNVFADALGRLGITPDTHVVVYDDVSGAIAARLWWMLRSVGHGHVQVLDGGYQAWVAAGGTVEVGDVAPRPTRYPQPGGFTGVVGYEGIPGRTVVDARAAIRYRGEHEPVDPKAGHIPGAINIPTTVNFSEDGTFRPATELLDVYRDLPPDTVVSCGSGVTACLDALAMVAAGLPMPDVYVGSFSEWSRRDLPVVDGPNP
jgi:thiosulfate/3-mercaptopyruvate sulfurtransferase